MHGKCRLEEAMNPPPNSFVAQSVTTLSENMDNSFTLCVILKVIKSKVLKTGETSLKEYKSEDYITVDEVKVLFRIKVANAKLLRDMITAISTLIDEATFKLSPDGISLRAMDPSHVAMVNFKWPKAVFDEYTCSEPEKLCINISELLKLIRRAGNTESAELFVDEKTNRLQLRIEGRYIRTFNLPTLEPMEEEVPVPKVTFNTKVEITTNGLRQALEDASLVSDHVRIRIGNESMTMQATGDLMGADIELKKGDEAILSLESSEESNATYSLSYLSEIVKAASALSEIVGVEFSTDMPIRLDFKQQEKGELVFYLAPRIDVE
jgi:proliferating cell nuclear antigen